MHALRASPSLALRPSNRSAAARAIAPRRVVRRAPAPVAALATDETPAVVKVRDKRNGVVAGGR